MYVFLKKIPRKHKRIMEKNNTFNVQTVNLLTYILIF